MADTLIEAAAAAGAISPDIVKVARTDIPPAAAIEELRRQFPDAFKPVFNARTATQAEVDARWREMQQADSKRRYDRDVAASLAVITAKYGAK